MKPYASKRVIELTQEQIEAAIPENASVVFHIMDRRVNFDQHSENPSLYSLARSWVQDDPCRSIPRPSLYDFRFEILPAAEIAQPKDDRNRQPKSDDNTRTESTDILSLVKRDQPSKPRRNALATEMVSRAKKARYQGRDLVIARAKATKLSLARKGIFLSQR
jgi:hypothetical protein